MKTKEVVLMKVAKLAKDMARTANGSVSFGNFHQPQVPAEVKAMKKEK